MGGVLILAAIVLSTLLWADLKLFYGYMLTSLAFGLIGGLDDTENPSPTLGYGIGRSFFGRVLRPSRRHWRST